MFPGGVTCARFPLLPAALAPLLLAALALVAAPALAQPTAPSEPRNLWSSATEYRKVTVQWEAPSSWGSETPRGYEIQFASARTHWEWNVYTPHLVTSDETSETFARALRNNIPFLQPGEPHNVRIRAYSGASGSELFGPWAVLEGVAVGTTAWTATLTVDTATVSGSTVAGCASSVTGVDTCATGISPSNAFAIGATTYTVDNLNFNTPASGDSFLYLTFDGVTTPAGNADLRHLSLRLDDEFFLFSLTTSSSNENYVQWSSPSLTLAWTDGQEVSVSLQELPGPAELTVTPEAQALRLSWTAPAADSADALAGYLVEYTSAPETGDGAVADDASSNAGNDPSAAWAEAGSVEGDPPATEYTLTGLAAGVEYRVRVIPIWSTNLEGSRGKAAAFAKGTPLGPQHLLVANYGQANNTHFLTDGYVTAQGFTTGAAPAVLGGVEVHRRPRSGLGSVDATFGTLSAADRGTLRAELWSAASGGGPDAKLADLAVPESVGEGTVPFAAPAGTALAAGTTYYFVIYTTGTVELPLGDTLSDDEDAGSRTGWSIEDNAWHIEAQAPSGSWTADDGVSLRIRVLGAELGVLVKNTARTSASTRLSSNNLVHAQRFTTGGNTGGYILSSVEAVLQNVPNATQRATVRAEVWSATDAGAPNEKKWDLTAPSSNTANEPASFAAPAGAVLEHNADYFVVLYTTGTHNLQIHATAATAEDSGKADGFSIADSRHSKSGQSPTAGTWTAADGPVKIAVNGYPRTDRTFSFSPGGYTIQTGAVPASMILALSRPAPEGGLAFALAPVYGDDLPASHCDGTAKADADDVSAAAPTTATVPAGRTESPEIRVALADNTAVRIGDADECFGVRASTDAAGWAAIRAENPTRGTDIGEVTIQRDQDGRVVFGTARKVWPSDPSADHAPAAVLESAGTVNVPVTVSYLPKASTTFNVEVVTSGANAGTAVEGTDFTIATKSVTFGPSDDASNLASFTKHVAVAIANDVEVENDETIALRLAAPPSGYVTHEDGRDATIRVLDDDDPPTTPPGGLAAERGHRSLALSWTKPTTGNLTGYDVHYTSSGAAAGAAAGGSDPAAGWVDAGHTGTGLGMTLTGLVNDRTYRIRVRGTAAGGTRWGPWARTTGTPIRTLSWVGHTDVAVEGESEAENLHVRMSEARSSDTTVDIVVAGGNAVEGTDFRLATKTLTIPAGRTEAILWFTSIYDLDTEGEENVLLDLSAPSGAPYILADPEQMEVAILDDKLPGAPGDFTVVPGDQRLDLTWTRTPGGPDGYDVEHRKLGASSWTDAGHTGADPSLAIAGLENNRGYELRVRWRYGAHRCDRSTGEGPCWAMASGVPTTQTLTLSVDRGLAEGGPDATLTATLSEPAVSARSVQIRQTGGDARGGISPTANADWSAVPISGEGAPPNIVPVITVHIAGGGTTATATLKVNDDDEIDPGETLVLTATSRGHHVGHGTPADMDLKATLASAPLALVIEDDEDGPPAAPTDLVATPGDGRLDLAWKAPAGDPPDGYAVQWTTAAAAHLADDATGTGPDPARYWKDAGHAGTDTEFALTGLANGVEHRVRVAGKNAVGTGKFAHAKGIPAAPLPANACAKPGAYPADGARASARGTPMIAYGADSPNDAVSGAFAQIKAAAAEWPARGGADDLPAGATAHAAPGFDVACPGGRAVSNLTPGADYDVRFHATDPDGVPYGDSTAPLRVTAWDVPGAPADLTASPAGDGELEIRWAAPAEAGGDGAAVTGYAVRWRRADTNATANGDQPGAWNEEEGVEVSATWHPADGLVNGAAYDVEVRALNGIDPGGAWARARGMPCAVAAAGDMLAGNLCQRAADGTGVDLGVGTYAQGFRAGAHAAGYALAAVDVALAFAGTLTADEIGTLRAELWSDASGSPSAKVADLAVPSDVASGIVAFAAPSGTVLAANASHHVVLYATSALSAAAPGVTASDVDDLGGASGWTVADGRRASASHDQSAAWTSHGDALRVRVRGQPVAVPPAGGTEWSATFTPPSVGLNLGCYTKATCDAALSDNAFTVGGAEFSITYLLYSTITSGLDLAVGTDANAALRALRFCTGSFAVAMDHNDPRTLVRNANAALDWQADVPVEIRIGADCATRAALLAPSAPPRNLRVTPGDGKLRLSWDPSGEGRATHYELQWKERAAPNRAAAGNDPATGWAVFTIGSPGLTGQGIVNLHNGTAYDVRLRTTNAAGAGAWATASGTPSGAVSVSLSASPNPVDEGAAVTVTATLAGTLADAVTVPVAVTRDTSESGDHGTISGIRIAPNARSGEARITTRHDGGIDDEAFTVALGGNLPSSLRAGSPSSVRIVIDDDDRPAVIPTVSLSASPNPVAEGSSTTVTATLSSALARAVTIPVATTRETSESGDHATISSIRIGANALSGEARVSTRQDPDTDDEAFSVALGGNLPSTVTAGTPSSVRIVIEDDDLPTATLSVSPTRVTEGASATVEVTLSSPAPAGGVTVPLAVTPGSAEPEDVGTLAGVTVPQNATGATAALATNHDADTADETFTVAIDAANLPATHRAGSPSSARITILDDDATVTLSASPNPVREGRTVTVAATLSRSLPDPVTVPLTVTGDGSEAGDHGTLSGIDIPAGRTRGTGEITTAEDADTEDEAFTVAFGTLPANLQAGATTSVRVEIADGDARASLSVSPNPVREGSNVTVEVTLSRALSSSVTVPVTVTADTAEEDDYGTLTGVRVAGGRTSGTATLATRQDDDADDEAFTVAIDAANLPSAVVAGWPLSARVAIDDDDTPTVDIDAEPRTVVAGRATTVRARLSAPLAADVTIPLAIEHETTDANDLRAPSGIRIGAGARSGEGTITTANDGDDEWEVFRVRLDTDNLPAEVAAGRLWVRVRIAPVGQLAYVSLSAAPNPVAEGEAVTVTAHLDPPRDEAVTVPVRVDSADPDAHGTLEGIEVAAGASSGSGALETRHDDDAFDETIHVSLDALGTGLRRGDPWSLDIRVEDDEAAPAGAGPDVWLLPSASDPGVSGTVRVANRSGRPGAAAVTATDDSGRSHAPVTLSLDAHAAAEFDAADLERGNPAKGLAGSTGPGTGAWRLGVASALDVEASAYAVARDGFAAPLGALVPRSEDGSLAVALFEPADRTDARSLLRLVNPGTEEAHASVSGIDDLGRPGLAAVRLTIPAGAACAVDAAQLETGTGLPCGPRQPGLGDGTGRWRLAVEADADLVAMNLLRGADGRLANLSAAALPAIAGAVRAPLFPAAGDPAGRQGVVRIVNRSNRAGTVRIVAADDTARAYAPLTLILGPGRAADLDADDLELGARAKGLVGSTGAGAGSWRLALTGDVEFSARAYVRARDGFLTAARPVVAGPGAEDRTPPLALLDGERGALRLANPGPEPATATLRGVDDAGARPAGPVRIVVPARSAVELTAADLASGDAAAIVSGALGAGTDRWRLAVEADAELAAMSLSAGPGGHTAELSGGGGTRRVPEAPAETPDEPEAAAER